MTVQRVTTIQRYIGLDTDTKPTSVNVGSTFWATDSKILYITPDGGTTWVVKSTADVPQADVDSFILADADDYAIADADADNERWNPEYLSGAEGGSADIDTTTADKLMVKVDPDATPTAARYAVSHNIAFFADYLTVTSDVSATWGATDSGTAKAVGILISKGASYDGDNIVAVERQKGTGVNRIQARATFGAVAQTSVNAAVTDDAVAFKIERWNNTWECFYSLSQYPGEVWVHLASFEDTADAMTEQVTFYNQASSPGSADAESAQGDFGHFRYYLGAGGGGQYIAGPFNSTFITSNADGNVFEREEYIQAELAKVPKSDSNVTWNATALASIQTEANDALVAQNLDHVAAVTTVAADMTAEVVDGSVVSRMLSKTSDTSSYDPTTDAQEMLSDKLGAFTGDGGAGQDDSAKASLDLAHTDLDAILADTGTDGVVVNSYTQAAGRAVGVQQEIAVSVTSAANAGDVVLATVTTQPVVIDSVVIHADAAQTGDMTSCGVFGGVGKVMTFVAAAVAVQASLNAADKQIGWTGAGRLAVGKTIVISLAGTGATAVDLTVTITYHAEVAGGYLA